LRISPLITAETSRFNEDPRTLGNPTDAPKAKKNEEGGVPPSSAMTQAAYNDDSCLRTAAESRFPSSMKNVKNEFSRTSILTLQA